MYKHLGVVDLISRQGGIDQTVDVYNNWPGFFLLNAVFLGAAGIATSLTYVAWAQTFFNLLYLLVLLFVFRSLTTDRRLVWLGTFLFFLGNWVGQDYFAPQAFGLLGYLVIVGICLRWLQPSAAPATGPVRAPTVDGGWGGFAGGGPFWTVSGRTSRAANPA